MSVPQPKIHHDPNYFSEANLRLEKWFSTENRHEEHYFLVDGLSAGYQESAYVFGYNPEIISPEKVKRILEIIRE